MVYVHHRGCVDEEKKQVLRLTTSALKKTRGDPFAQDDTSTFVIPPQAQNKDAPKVGGGRPFID
jgi:hypothetical protein